VRESEVQDRDGHWHRLQIRPYKTTDNRIDGAVLSLFDIDALKHHITQVQQANSDAARDSHTKDDFLATLSHELRTPLSSMLMRAQMLRQGGMDDAKVQRAGEAIENGVRLQVQLIDDLLDVSRIVSGKLTMSFHPVDVARVVRRAIEGLGAAAQRKSMKVDAEVAIADSTARVLADDARLHQVFTNLLANAIKFTPEHGTVRVTITVGEDTAVIKVRDTGMGIAANFLPTIFNRFTQENSTSTRAYGGLGLGLAIVRHLIELHHGTVVAESAGVGHGATFTVTLPLVRAVRAPISAAALRPAPLDPAVLVGHRILVVDDDGPTREVIAEILGRTGAKVRLAASASEGMTAVGEFQPDLLICDVAMPGEDGYSFIRRLRSLGVVQSGTIPALALTALAHDDDRERALAAGFQIHLAKPVDIDRLTRAVLELAASRGTAPPPPRAEARGEA
jgi:two-component system CheB/CheR fusion protein